MANLTSSSIANTYDQLLNLAGPVTTSLQGVTDGVGNPVGIELSSTQVNIPSGFTFLINGSPVSGLTDPLGFLDLTDPDADRIPFWDDSAGAIAWLTVGSNLTITDTTISATGGGGGADLDTANEWTAIQSFVTTDAGTTTVVRPAIVGHNTSGTAAAGLGVGLQFNVEVADGEDLPMAYIDAVSTDVAAGTEDFDLSFKVATAGAAPAEVMSVNAAALTVAGDVTATTIGGITEANLLDKSATETVSGSWTFSGTTGTVSGAWDFGGATSLEIPNGAAPTVNAAGEIAVDTTITDYTGMIKYHDGTEELTVLAVPTANLSTTDGQTVAYNAANNELEFVTPSAGGSDFVLLSTAAALSSSSLDFTGLGTTYAAYMFIINGLIPGTDSTNLTMRFSKDNGSSFDSGASSYYYAYMGRSTSAATGAGSAGASSILLGDGAGNVTTVDSQEGFSGCVMLYGAGSTVSQTRITSTITLASLTGVKQVSTASGHYLNGGGSDVDAVQFLASGGNLAQGTIHMYGLLAT